MLKGTSNARRTYVDIEAFIQEKVHDFGVSPTCRKRKDTAAVTLFVPILVGVNKDWSVERVEIGDHFNQNSNCFDASALRRRFSGNKKSTSSGAFAVALSNSCTISKLLLEATHDNIIRQTFQLLSSSLNFAPYSNRICIRSRFSWVDSNVVCMISSS